ncbi:kinase-like protein [Calocera cornea HHB12733]|uniref:Kinase-like protein n=1 Tax=Calocera cornea HHB12733 TaxID=1353952 RepID=A0A165F0G7_9BASI|nr:kinase-like protein [Calocera cornea HHB12733]
MTETHNGALKLELQGLLDAGCEALRFPNLFEAGALALFHALRSLLTLDNVPSSVRLSDLDLGSMAVISNPGSDIFRTQWRGTVVAIKRFRESNSNPRRAGRFLYAGAIWRMLDHPNVLPFYGIHIQDMGSRKSIALVTLWADNSDVLNYMRIRPDCDRRSLVKQTASGLAYLHRHGIVHGDVRGSNILIDGQGRPMLGDYGQASALTSDPEALIEGLSTSEISSTIRWLAPELTHTRFPELPADVFSFGRTILELMTGEKPFNEHRNVWQIASMLNQGRLSPKRPADPRVVQRGLTDEVWELMGEMWENAPAERPEMDVVEERLEQLM